MSRTTKSLRLQYLKVCLLLLLFAFVVVTATNRNKGSYYHNNNQIWLSRNRFLDNDTDEGTSPTMDSDNGNEIDPKNEKESLNETAEKKSGTDPESPPLPQGGDLPFDIEDDGNDGMLETSNKNGDEDAETAGSPLDDVKYDNANNDTAPIKKDENDKADQGVISNDNSTEIDTSVNSTVLGTDMAKNPENDTETSNDGENKKQSKESPPDDNKVTGTTGAVENNNIDIKKENSSFVPPVDNIDKDKANEKLNTDEGKTDDNVDGKVNDNDSPDPCISAVSCNDCQEKAKILQKADDIFSCWWNDGDSTCRKELYSAYPDTHKMCIVSCETAHSCQECKILAESKVQTDDHNSCFWNDDTCTDVSRNDEDDIDNMCDIYESNDIPPPNIPDEENNPAEVLQETKPVTKPDEAIQEKKPETKPNGVIQEKKPETKPNEVNEETKPNDNNISKLDDENEIPWPGVLIVIGVIAVCGACIVRRNRSKPSGYSPVTPNGYRGRTQYQGVATHEDTDDEEWGWDDDPKSSKIEVTKVTSVKPKKSASPNLTHRHLQPDEVFVDKPKRSSSTYSRGSRSSRDNGESPPQNRKNGVSRQLSSEVPKNVQLVVTPKPDPDDFFEQMGFTAKPSFVHNRTVTSSSVGMSTMKTGSSPFVKTKPAEMKPSVKRLGATVLTSESDSDMGAADWDDDLDDLLND